jgi:hypothetical protein
MMRVRSLASISLLLLLFACGGSAPPPATPASPPASASAASADEPPPTTSSSVVHFDDLGVSLDVPSGFRVMGDDELASRIRASANPRLTASLEQHAGDRQALPLLTISKQTTSPSDALTITLAVAKVPPDTTASEMLTEQKTVMSENLAQFAVVDGPKDISLDGVAGSEITNVYATKANASSPTHKATLRLFVRHDILYMLSAVWLQSSPPERETEARALEAGLHFYPPTKGE